MAFNSSISNKIITGSVVVNPSAANTARAEYVTFPQAFDFKRLTFIPSGGIPCNYIQATGAVNGNQLELIHSWTGAGARTVYYVYFNE